MMRANRIVAISLLTVLLMGCGTKIDPSLRPYVGGLKKDNKDLFLSKTVDQQIDIYLRIAALPLRPRDFSLSSAIATCNGDIGQNLSNRLTTEADVNNVQSLIRLAGDYCALNTDCADQAFLKTSAQAAANRLPASDRTNNPYLEQSLRWVSMGVAKQFGDQLKRTAECK